MPLVLTHGWPGTFVEFLDVVGRPGESRRPGRRVPRGGAVAPRLRATATSRTHRDGTCHAHRARRGTTLMRDLGYEHYGAQGGDWGAMVTTSIGQQCAEHVTGIHVNMPVVNFGRVRHDRSHRAGEQRARPSRRARGLGHGLLGRAVHPSADPRLRPHRLPRRPVRVDPREVLGVDRQPGPSRAGADQGPDARRHLALLVHRARRASSARLYWESFKSVDMAAGRRARQGCRRSRRRSSASSERWARTRFTDLRWYGAPSRGGHFAAFEQPEIFVDEVRGFFRTVR